MDANTTVVIVVALFVILAVAAFLVYRGKARVNIKGPAGMGMEIDASNDAPTTEPKPAVNSDAKPAINIENVESTGGGIVAEDGTGRGVNIKGAKTADDILASSSDPKANPPA